MIRSCGATGCCKLLKSSKNPPRARLNSRSNSVEPAHETTQLFPKFRSRRSTLAFPASIAVSGFPFPPLKMKPHPKIIDHIIDTLRERRSFCVVGHVRPDGDCVGSQL